MSSKNQTPAFRWGPYRPCPALKVGDECHRSGLGPAKVLPETLNWRRIAKFVSTTPSKPLPTLPCLPVHQSLFDLITTTTINSTAYVHEALLYSASEKVYSSPLPTASLLPAPPSTNPVALMAPPTIDSLRTSWALPDLRFLKTRVLLPLPAPLSAPFRRRFPFPASFL